MVIYAGAKTGKILDLIHRDRGSCSSVHPYESPQTIVDYLTWPAAVRRGAFHTVGGGMLAISYLVQDEGLALDRLLVVS